MTFYHEMFIKHFTLKSDPVTGVRHYKSHTNKKQIKLLLNSCSIEERKSDRIFSFFFCQTLAQTPCRQMQMTSRVVSMSLRSVRVWVERNRVLYREVTSWCLGPPNLLPYSSLKMWWDRWEGVCMPCVNIGYQIKLSSGTIKDCQKKVRKKWLD